MTGEDGEDGEDINPVVLFDSHTISYIMEGNTYSIWPPTIELVPKDERRRVIPEVRLAEPEVCDATTPALAADARISQYVS